MATYKRVNNRYLYHSSNLKGRIYRIAIYHRNNCVIYSGVIY